MATAKKTTAKETAVKETAAKKTATKKTAVKETTAKETAVKETTAKETTAKKVTAKKATAKKTAVKETAVKETATKKVMTKEEQAQFKQELLMVDIVKDGFTRGLSDDEIKGNMVGSGLPFGKVNRVFTLISIAKGFRADPKVAMESAKNAVENFDSDAFTTWGTIELAIDDIIEQVSDELGILGAVTYSKVLSLIKTHCKKNKINFPTKAKKAAKKSARGGKIASAIAEQLRKDKGTTKETMYDIIRPLVKGHKNAIDSVNTFFPLAFACANGISMIIAIDKLKDQTMPESD